MISVLLAVVSSFAVLPVQAFDEDEAPAPGSDYPTIDAGEVILGEHSEYGAGACVDLGEAGNSKIYWNNHEYTDYIYENTDISESRSYHEVRAELLAHIPAQLGGVVSDDSHWDDVACMYQYEMGGASDKPN